MVIFVLGVLLGQSQRKNHNSFYDIGYHTKKLLFHGANFSNLSQQIDELSVKLRGIETTINASLELSLEQG